MQRRSLLFLLTAATFLSSCLIVVGDGGWSDGNRGSSRALRGSGHIVEETRTSSEFHAIQLDLGADVDVRIGGETSVLVRGDDNLVGLVRTPVRNGVLHLEVEGSRPLRGDLSFEITTPHLRSFEIDGAGSVTIAGVEGEEFRARIDGAGTLRASGSVQVVLANIDGAGDLLLQDLHAQNAKVEIDGAGDIHVRAAVSLRYEIDGAGQVNYYGDPRVSGVIDGAGSVHSR